MHAFLQGTGTQYGLSGGNVPCSKSELGNYNSSSRMLLSGTCTLTCARVAGVHLGNTDDFLVSSVLEKANKKRTLNIESGWADVVVKSALFGRFVFKALEVGEFSKTFLTLKARKKWEERKFGEC